MTTRGREQRELFTTVGAKLFDEIVTNGGLPQKDPRFKQRGEYHAALDLLRDIGLVIADKDSDTWTAVDPSTAQSSVVTPLSSEGARLLAESSEWAEAFNQFSQAWRRAPGPATGPFTEVRGEAIGPFIASIVADAEFELLTAQPQGSRKVPNLEPTIKAATVRDLQALERGVTLRTLYQHSARRNSLTHKYVAAVTAKGAEVRTLDEFFNRMIVVDRRIVVIPHHEGPAAALAVREPSVVAYFVDIFERSWDRARPFTNRETTMMKDIAAEQRAMTIRMLIEGHADPASAKRLGVSPRTYAGYVADLKAEYESETRFQLGYAMGQLGISGQEQPDNHD